MDLVLVDVEEAEVVVVVEEEDVEEERKVKRNGCQSPNWVV